MNTLLAEIYGDKLLQTIISWGIVGFFGFLFLAIVFLYLHDVLQRYKIPLTTNTEYDRILP